MLSNDVLLVLFLFLSLTLGNPTRSRFARGTIRSSRLIKRFLLVRSLVDLAEMLWGIYSEHSLDVRRDRAAISIGFQESELETIA